ncbi:MAG: hypothetical protein K2X60_04595 [Xanthobacteraceae bacterium]|nr:hypothetical protein [Xanthobacteraceae bacterium]
MKSMLLTVVIMAILAASSASAHQHHAKHRRVIVTGESANAYGYSDRPQSPVSSYSGAVTHPDEQAKGLVPGSTNADGGYFRNLGH